MPLPLGVLARAGAGGGAVTANAYEWLETTILTSNQNSVTFSNLNTNYASTYKHLQIRLVARSSSGSAANYAIRMNSVTASGNYNCHYVSGSGSGINVGSGTGSGITDKIFAQVVPGDTNIFAGAIIDFIDPFSTQKNKTIRVFNGSSRSGTNWLDLSSGLFLSTSAISSIELGITATFATGSRFSLYGIRSA